VDKPQRGLTLGEILGHDNGDSPKAQVFRIWLDLFYSGAEYEDRFLQLPVCDRYIWLVRRFGGEVDNGGLDQFLFNSSGDYFAETLEALAAIGAPKCHWALEQACALFPNGRPSVDYKIREDQVREIVARFGGRHIDDIVGVGELESNLSELLLDFRRRNAPPDATG
jgi:hypothetical protein